MFDGYEAGPTTKDHEHLRRSLKKRGVAEITFNKETKVKMNQEAFLSNEKNKAQFVKMLSEFLIEDGQMVRNCKEYADTEIALSVTSAICHASYVVYFGSHISSHPGSGQEEISCC